MASSSTTAQPHGRPWRRVRFPMATLIVVAAALTVVWLIPPDAFERGMRVMITMIATVVGGGLMLAWFLLFSGASGITRAVALIITLALVAVAMASVRRVEFSGDMIPTFDFRWARDRNDILEGHRAERAKSGAATPLAEIVIGPRDIPDYRGFKRDGIVVGPALSRGWQPQAPRLAWRQPVGGGYASYAVVGPLAITIEQRREKEAVVAYDAATGIERWVHDYPALFSEKLGGDGPRATPTVRDGRVFSLGATGVLVCLDLATGESRWSQNILEVNHSGNTEWGMCGSPLVYDGLVVVNPGNQKGTAESRAILAFSADTGELVFSGGASTASYSSPMLAELAGTHQVLIFDAAGLAGFDAAVGKELWRVPWKSDFDINAGQPIVLGDDRVFISSGAGCAVFHVIRQGNDWTAKEVWKTRNLKSSYGCPIALDGYVYGLDEGILACVEVSTGKRRWKGGRYGHGQLLLSGDLLVVLTEKGELALVEATPDAFHELGLIQAIEGKTWNNPALRDGRIFVRNHLEMATYDLPLLGADSP